MRSQIRNIVIVLAAVAISVWAINPPSEKLRLGKDLAGGVSLVYAVEIDANDRGSDTLSRMIEVLKKRVNPTGALDIAMVAQGGNRIEISMPLPSARVRALKEAYERALAALDERAVDPAELERIFRLAGAERDEAIARFAKGDERRAALARAGAEAADAARSARRAYDEARAAGAEPAALDPLIEQTAAAEIAADKARADVLASAVSREEVQTAIELPDVERTVIDREKNEAVAIPSARKRALERLTTEHPDAVPAINGALSAYETFSRERKGLDDPQDLIRLLRGAGVLHFRIAPRPGEVADEARLRAELAQRGPKGVRGGELRWYEIENVESWTDTVQDFRALKDDPVGFFNQMRLVGAERDGLYYLLLYDAPGLRLTEAEGSWRVASAFGQPDERGLPGIVFNMDTPGARLLGELTGANVDRPMAIVLDDKVYQAPTLNSRISDRGIITGGSTGFQPAQVDYIVRTLAAGSLAAKLGEEPLATDVSGPELGADNLRKGLVAGVYSLIAVSACVILWYFTSGVIAVVGLVINILMLLGLMSLGNAAFTLPGIAGVVLTIGMAVDANVLIYERIREEQAAGQSLRNAVRNAFRRASAAIIDGNLTNLIVCFALYWTGTVEIRGFAVTLGIGVVTTLFSALIVTRLLMQGLIALGAKRISTLPDSIPPLGRLLLPSFDWLRVRWGFYIVSVVLTVLGAGAVVYQGRDLLDNEFRGGTAATIELKKVDPDGSGPQPAAPLLRTRFEIEKALHDHVASLGSGSHAASMITADVVAINPQADQVTSSTFKIKTVLADASVVSETITDAFPDLLDAHPPVRFASIGFDPILQPILGENIARPDVRDNVSEYVGGVAVVVVGLDPPISLNDLRVRTRQIRAQPDNVDAVTRKHDIIVLEGSAESVRAAAILAIDPAVSFFDDESRWRADVARVEERIATDALERGATLAGVQSFSPAIASNFVAKAVTSALFSVVGILIYLWLRFGSVRYSLAAVVADVHDAFVAIGMVAIVGLVYEHAPGVAAALGLAPFKINLAMTAAILTVLGYSLNDSIVVMDRIRENRGKLAYASREVINLSLNQTLARTLLTGGTTLVSAVILYSYGGETIRGFAFAIFIGVIVGTYSSMGLAAPIVWTRKAPAVRPAGSPASAGASSSLVAT